MEGGGPALKRHLQLERAQYLEKMAWSRGLQHQLRDEISMRLPESLVRRTLDLVYHTLGLYPQCSQTITSSPTCTRCHRPARRARLCLSTSNSGLFLVLNSFGGSRTLCRCGLAVISRQTP